MVHNEYSRWHSIVFASLPASEIEFSLRPPPHLGLRDCTQLLPCLPMPTCKTALLPVKAASSITSNIGCLRARALIHWRSRRSCPCLGENYCSIRLRPPRTTLRSILMPESVFQQPSRRKGAIFPKKLSVVLILTKPPRKLTCLVA